MSSTAARVLREIKSSRLLVTAVCLFIILSGITALALHSVQRHQEIFHDFRVFYTAGQMWAQGGNPYQPDLYAARFSEINGYSSVFAVFYPPQTLVLFSLLTLLPLEQAHWMMFAANALLLAASFALMLAMLRRHIPIRIYEITFLVLLICTSFGRTNLGNPQFGILIAALLFSGFLLQQNNRPILSGLAFAAISVKPSFLPLYAVYYLFTRNFKLAAAMIGGSAVLTLAPVILSGRPLLQTLLDWLTTLRMQNLPGAIDSPDPASHLSVFMVNLEPLVYRVLGSQSTAGLVIFVAVSLALLIFTGRLIRQSRPAPHVDLLDFALISALSLLLVYHRNYDIFLLFPGLLYIYSHAQQNTAGRPRLIWHAFLALVLVILLAPNEIVVQFAGRNPALWDNYFFRLISTYLGWTNVVVLAALLWLKVQATLTNAVRAQVVTANRQAESIR